MLMIDGHAHACGSFLDCESVKSYLDAHHIDKVVLCGGEPGSGKDYTYPMLSNIFKSEKLGFFFNRIICQVTKKTHVAEHISEQNRKVFHMQEELPDKIINAYWVNPLEEDCMEKMDEFFEVHDFKLIKLHQCWNAFDLENGKCGYIFEWAAEHNMPVFIHLRSKEQVEKFIKTANQYGDTIFIVAHLIGSDTMAGKLVHHNVYFDLSAPQLYSMDMLRRAVTCYGTNRLILGSDTPYGTDNVDKVKKRLKTLELTEEQKEAIYGKNIADILFI